MEERHDHYILPKPFLVCFSPEIRRIIFVNMSATSKTASSWPQQWQPSSRSTLDWMQRLWADCERSSRIYGPDVVPQGKHLQRAYAWTPEKIMDTLKKEDKARASSQGSNKIPGGRSAPSQSKRSKSTRAPSRRPAAPSQSTAQADDDDEDLFQQADGGSSQPRTHLQAQTLCHQLGKQFLCCIVWLHLS